MIPFTLKVIQTERAMLSLGKKIAHYYSGGSVIYLSGELGTGKTTLVRGFLRGLGYSGFVKSPSYTLVEIYKLSNIEVVHVDLYRLMKPEDYLNLGVDDFYLKNHSVLLIEWPEKLIPLPTLKLIPLPTLWIKIDIQGKKRVINFKVDSFS